MNNMGKKIKEARLYNGFTQRALADKLHLTQDSISLWEQGKRLPDTQYLPNLCINLKITADYLLGLEDETGKKLYEC